MPAAVARDLRARRRGYVDPRVEVPAVTEGRAPPAEQGGYVARVRHDGGRVAHDLAPDIDEILNGLDRIGRADDVLLHALDREYLLGEDVLHLPELFKVPGVHVVKVPHLVNFFRPGRELVELLDIRLHLVHLLGNVVGKLLEPEQVGPDVLVGHEEPLLLPLDRRVAYDRV